MMNWAATPAPPAPGLLAGSPNLGLSVFQPGSFLADGLGPVLATSACGYPVVPLACARINPAAALRWGPRGRATARLCCAVD